MDRKSKWKELWRRVSLVSVLLIGGFSFIFGFVEIVVGPAMFDPKIPALLLFSVGVLVTVSVIDRRSEKEEHKEKLQEYERIHESLESLKPAISAVLGAVETGVENIFARRKQDFEAQRAIEAHLLDEQTKTISIAAVALPRFFRDPVKYGKAIQNRLDSDDVHWRILLLNPQGEAAKERARREKATDTEQDIELSIKRLQEYMDDGKNIEVRLYDCPPILFLLIIDSSMLVEPYHFGRIIQPDGDRPLDKRVVRGCIGGQVPLLQIRNLGQHDKAYAIFCDHFEYIWHERSIPVYSGISIAECKPSAKIVKLESTHRFTSVWLKNWNLEGRYGTRTPGGDGDGMVKQTIYQFTDEDRLKPQAQLEIRDGKGERIGAVRYLNPGPQVSTFMKEFWAHEDRELRLVNMRKRTVAKFPNDGYIGPERFPESIMGGDIY